MEVMIFTNIQPINVVVPTTGSLRGELMVEVDFPEAEQITSDTLYIICHMSTHVLDRPLQPALLGPLGIISTSVKCPATSLDICCLGTCTFCRVPCERVQLYMKPVHDNSKGK